MINFTGKMLDWLAFHPLQQQWMTTLAFAIFPFLVLWRSTKFSICSIWSTEAKGCICPFLMILNDKSSQYSCDDQSLLSWTPLTWFSNLSWHYLHEHPAHVTPTSLTFPTGNVDSYTVTNIPSNKVSNPNEWEVRHLQTLRENKMHQCVQQVTLRLQLSVKQFVLLFSQTLLAKRTIAAEVQERMRICSCFIFETLSRAPQIWTAKAFMILD